MKILTTSIFILLLSLLSACGGGSSGNSVSPEPTQPEPEPPAPPSQPQNFSLSFEANKLFQFKWDAAEGAEYYRLQENPNGISGFSQVGEDIPQDSESYALEVPLYARINAQYLLQACNTGGCSDSQVVTVDGTLVDSIGYFKASNTDEYDLFGSSISLSDDGTVLAVGAISEDSNATGINGDQSNNDAPSSGAVYVFTRTDTNWVQQAYIKASNTEKGDGFGFVSLSSNGNTLAVGAPNEDGNATGINGDESNNDVTSSGAVYVFIRTDATWTQEAYLKASTTGEYYRFGSSISLSNDGDTLAVGAYGESSDSTGINGDQTNDNANHAGAVYVFTRTVDTWNQQAYIKASNTEEHDQFGSSISLSGDGNTLAVGANEDSNASGIDGDQSNNDAPYSGAVYVFARTDTSWAQQAYMKSSNNHEDSYDYFGTSVSLSEDGNTLAVGVKQEESNATGINGDQSDNSLDRAGAVYVYTRTDSSWAQQAYIKASNTGEDDRFGNYVSLSNDGNNLAVGASYESSNANGINGDQTNNDTPDAGAVYMFTRTDTIWAQQAYIKASNTDEDDHFGGNLNLSGDGSTLAIGARVERSNATGINGDQSNNDLTAPGAVYVY
ncbi:histidine kinase [Microbulbifer sp. JMSA003]|uniref:histidine kinase n=1 Tax=Microbulbifer sp. JMSA003 TaxID=3243369 RepID=UPI004039DC31